MGGVQVLLELCIANFICWLIPPVKWGILLDCIVGEMDFSFEVEDIELVGGGSDVPLLIPVGLEDSV